MDKYAKNNLNKIIIGVFINMLLTFILIYTFSSIIQTEFYYTLYLCIALSVFINVILIVSSNLILLKLNDAKKLPLEYSNRLETLIKELSNRYGIKTPEIKLLDVGTINSLSIGLSSDKSYILLTKGTLDNLNHDELEYILSYEILKISKRQTSLYTILTCTIGLIVILSDIFFRSIYRAIEKRGKESESFMRLLLTTIFLILAPLFTWIIQLFIPKSNDLLNDKLYLNITNKPLPMISTLKKAQEINKLNNMFSRACTNMFFVNPLVGQKVSKRFSYHTSISKRIEYIKNI